jgi:serine/threonine protein kinase
MTDIAKRLGGVLRGAQDQKLGRRAVRAGILSEEELARILEHPNGGVEALLRSRGVSSDQIRLLRAEIDREDYALFRPDRPPPPEVIEAGSDPDRRLAEFVLVSRLGQGGIGEVWKAWDTRLGRWVAVKLPVHTPDQENVARRFTREALAAARLSHPNIVSIYRVAEEGGRTFIVMQYVEGRTLTGLRLPPGQSLEMMRTVALAVHHAHEQGVIHRDLKPGNIMIGADGRAFVLDFGLAHLEEAGRAHSRDNLVAGTAAYMSPEQARGEPGARERATDIYALGATFYEVMTGRPPFQGASFADTLEKLLYREPVPPRSLAPSVPRDVEMVILKAMDKDPARRYATARDLAEDLDRCLRGDPVLAREASLTRTIRRGIRKHPRVLSFVATLLAGIGVLLLWGGVESRRERERKLEAFRGPAEVALRAVLELRRAGANERMAGFRPPALKDRAPEAAEVDYLRGRIQRALLDDAGALGFQDRALAKDPDFAPAIYERLILLAKGGGRHREEILAEGARLSGLDAARLLVAKGIVAMQQGEFGPARDLLEKAIGVDGSLEEAWEALGRSWLTSVGPRSPAAAQAEAVREADEVLTRALERDRGYVPHWIARGRARASRGQLRCETGEDPEIEFQSAEDDFAEALRRHPSAEGWVGRAALRIAAAAHGMRFGQDPRRRLVEAESDLADALRAEPGNGAALATRCRLNRLAAEHHGERGQSVSGDCEAVERDAALGGGAWLDRAVAWGCRAASRASMGQEAAAEFDRAEGFFAEALKAAAGDAEVWERRAFVRFLRGADLPAAESDATRAIQMASFFPQARLTRAKIRRARSSFDEALMDLTDALGVNAVFTEAWEERGRLELSWGKSRLVAGDRGGAREHFVQAVRHFEEAARLNPDLAGPLRAPLREAQRAILGPN